MPLAQLFCIEPKFCLPSNNKGHNSDQNWTAYNGER